MFPFHLPPERIARHPPPSRDGGRLLCVPTFEHRQITDLTDLLGPGDVLVVNDTRVMHARLHGRRATGGAVQVFLLQPGPGDVEALVRPGRRLKEGERLDVGEGSVQLLRRHDDGRWTVRCSPEPLALMDAHGEVPLPPYLNRDAEASDAERYQTTFAREPGAVAAPTAGLHLSRPLRDRLVQRGVRFATITLHVGIGTFRPLRQEDIDCGELHPEWYSVSEETVQIVQAAQRVIAVGTTSTRALESASTDGVLRAGSGVTRLFIQPGYSFQIVDGLLTNFHLPGSSLLMLVCALGGTTAVQKAYAEAIERGYRFYSYGDAMLLL